MQQANTRTMHILVAKLDKNRSVQDSFLLGLTDLSFRKAKTRKKKPFFPLSYQIINRSNLFFPVEAVRELRSNVAAAAAAGASFSNNRRT